MEFKTKDKLLNILKYPNIKLRKKCVNVELTANNINNIQKMIDLMFKTMKFYQGVGLAAPQVGVGYRVLVINAENQQISMINPEIVEIGGDLIEQQEACLSLPGVYGHVTRNSKVKVKFLDYSGIEQEKELEGLLARIFLHENDHLDGVLFLDKVSTLRKEMIIKRMKKLGFI